MSNNDIKNHKNINLEDLNLSGTQSISQQKVADLVQELQIHQVELSVQNQTLIDTAQELERSRDRLSFLYHQAPIGYVTLNDAGMIVEHNQRLCEILNMDTKKILYKPFAHFIHDDDKKIYFARLKAFLKKPENKFMEIRLKKEESFFYSKIEGRYIPWGVKDDTFNGNILLTITDISKEKELEERLRIKHRMETASTMAGGIAHEFNNILSIILGNIELSLMKETQDKEILNNLHDIKMACIRAKNVTGKILKFSNFLDYSPVEISAQDLINEVCKKIGRKSPCPLKINSPNEKINVVVDHHQIKLALKNILENAVYAMNKRSGSITIDIYKTIIDSDSIEISSGIFPGNYIAFKICDSGEGIKPEDKEKIFDPFFSTKPFGQGQGTGLSIAHGIVKKHGGFINVESVYQSGSCFTVHLPF